MATALSRALKMPGKKGSELGEYDPLTQVDSEDESEEDDLVLNYPRNGLTSHSHAATLRLGQEGAELHEEDEEEEETWRHSSGKDRRSEAGRVVDEGVGLVSDGAGKKEKVRTVMRTTAFMVPLICATMFVLLFAFLLPCHRGRSHRQKEWETKVGHAGGVASPPMALWDVDGNGVEDLIVAVMTINNNNQQISFFGLSKEYSVVALNGVNGSVMWNRSLKESLSSVQCSAPSTCLLITSTHLSSINASTGKKLWEVTAGAVESQAVAVPDLQDDSIPDLLIATLPADQESALSLVLHSGLTGSLIGQPVNFNFTAHGKLIGPLLHETVVGAYYILFGLGTVAAVSLRDVYKRATGWTNIPSSLRMKDPVWEKQSKNNSSTLIKIYRGAGQVEYFLPLVAGICNNHNNLDAEANRNSSHSDWVLVCKNSQISIIRERDIHTTWTITSSSIHSRPAIGHFNDDGIPDLLIQQSVNGIRKVQIVDGARGRACGRRSLSVPALFWKVLPFSPHPVSQCFSFGRVISFLHRRTLQRTGKPSKPILRRLFLLHPAYPAFLQELTTTTDTALTATVSYDDEQKDVSYIMVVSRPVSGPGPGTRLVKSVSVRASLISSTTVHLSDNKHTHTHTAFQISKFFRTLYFRRH